MPGERHKKVLVAAGGRRGKDVKIIMKGLDHAVREHLTLKITEDARFDLHMTKETNFKAYVPLVKGKIDVEQAKKRAEALREKWLTPVDVRDPELSDYVLLVLRYDNAFQEFVDRFYIRGNKRIIPSETEAEENAEHIEEYFHVAFMDEVEEYERPFAIWMSPDGEQYGILGKTEGEYYLLTISEAIKILPESFKPERMFCPECGTELDLEAETCHNCGLELR